MNELIEKLKKARTDESTYKAILKAMTEQATKELHERPAWTEASTALEKVSASVSELEEEIRKQAVTFYAENQNKHPHPKVEIKLFKVFKIVDPSKVLAWVKTNLADALLYDAKKVETYVKNIGPVDGCSLAEEPRAQIAKEL